MGLATLRAWSRHCQSRDRSEHRQAGRLRRPFFTGLNNELADKGFLVTAATISSPGPAPARSCG